MKFIMQSDMISSIAKKEKKKESYKKNCTFRLNVRICYKKWLVYCLEWMGDEDLPVTGKLWTTNVKHLHSMKKNEIKHMQKRATRMIRAMESQTS